MLYSLNNISSKSSLRDCKKAPNNMNLLKWVIPWSAYCWGGNLKCKVINYTGC